jgi:hypothetical protein
MPSQLVEKLLWRFMGRTASCLTRLPAVGTTDDDTAKKGSEIPVLVVSPIAVWFQ